MSDDFRDQCKEALMGLRSGEWHLGDLEVFVRQFIAAECEACAQIVEKYCGGYYKIPIVPRKEEKWAIVAVDKIRARAANPKPR